MEYQGSEYDAILVRGTPRFRKNRKMVAADTVPQNVREALVFQLNQKDVEPSAEVKPQEAGIAPLGEKDFTDTLSASVSTIEGQGMPSKYEMELIQQLEDVKRELSEGNAKAKTLPELAKEMHERFGIYTVFTGHAPKDGDAHPFNGQVMTRYELGLAYQQFNRTQAQGLLNTNFQDQVATQRQSQAASTVHAQEIEDRRQGVWEDPNHFPTFAERTSVRGQNQSSMQQVSHNNDPISEDATVEPNLRGQTIRENW